MGTGIWIDWLKKDGCKQWKAMEFSHRRTDINTVLIVKGYLDNNDDLYAAGDH